MRARGGRPSEALDDKAILRALKALADPTRFRIVEEVARGGELSCGQVVERLGTSQPTISHHVKILTDAGLLVSRSEGKHHFLSVSDALVAALAEVLPQRLASTGRR
jgi:ArsR family transcriptional regulator